MKSPPEESRIWSFWNHGRLRLVTLPYQNEACGLLYGYGLDSPMDTSLHNATSEQLTEVASGKADGKASLDHVGDWNDYVQGRKVRGTFRTRWCIGRLVGFNAVDGRALTNKSGICLAHGRARIDVTSSSCSGGTRRYWTGSPHTADEWGPFGSPSVRPNVSRSSCACTTLGLSHPLAVNLD